MVRLGDYCSGNCKEDDTSTNNNVCQGSLTMTCRCKRIHFLVLLPLLAAASLVINVSLLIRHENETAQEGTSGQPPRAHVPMPASSIVQQNSLAHRLQKETAKTRLTLEQEIRQQKKILERRKRREKVPLIEPEKESLSDDAVFSACLLIKDDNEILDEWIAYHYHALKLRHIVVATDPLSVESPIEILRKWENLTDLEFVSWGDEHYMPESFIKTGKTPFKYRQDASDFPANTSESALMEISNHRFRQRVFLSECIKYYRENQGTWVMHIDTDEYVVASKLLRQLEPEYLDILSPDQPGSVMSLLQQVVKKTPTLVSYPCISMLRLLFGSLESQQDSSIQHDSLIQQNFDIRSFETLRWKHHAFPNNITVHGNPKVILDVSAIPDQYFPKKGPVFSIHRPIREFCPRNKDLDYESFRKQPIAVNHYLGSWERYNGRTDQRRSRAKYDSKSSVNFGTDTGIQTWLTGFVETMGLETASKLVGNGHLRTPQIE